MADSDDEEYENTDCGRQPENGPESGDGPRLGKRVLPEDQTGGSSTQSNKKIRPETISNVILFL